MQKKLNIRIVSVLIVVSVFGLMLLTSFLLASCTSPSGIRNGYYALIDQSGKLKDRESPGWSINNNNAKYSVASDELNFRIVEEENIYFEIIVQEASKDDVTVVRYEVKYDKKTQILTVYMDISFVGSSPDGFFVAEMEIKEIQFKKTGLFY